MYIVHDNAGRGAAMRLRAVSRTLGRMSEIVVFQKPT
jgi:hypothetical protein